MTICLLTIANKQTTTQTMQERVNPSTKFLSSGLYSFLSQDQQNILDSCAKKKVYSINSKPIPVIDALLLCQVNVEGIISIQKIEFVFPDTTPNQDIVVRAYPIVDRPCDMPMKRQRIRYVAEYKNNIYFRVRLADLHAEIPAYEVGIKVAQERLAYFLMFNTAKISKALVAMVFLIQSLIRPTKEYVEELVSTTRLSPQDPQIIIWQLRYSCLQARNKHDMKSCEATKAPYEVYTHQLERVDIPMATKYTILPNSEDYLLVPPLANVYLCLLRKSLKLITPQKVTEFLLRPGNTGAYLNILSSHNWSNNNIKQRDCTTTKDIEVTKKELGVLDLLSPEQQKIQTIIHTSKKIDKPILFSKILTWDTSSISWYGRLLFNHRVLSGC